MTSKRGKSLHQKVTLKHKPRIRSVQEAQHQTHKQEREIIASESHLEAQQAKDGRTAAPKLRMFLAPRQPACAACLLCFFPFIHFHSFNSFVFKVWKPPRGQPSCRKCAHASSSKAAIADEVKR